MGNVLRELAANASRRGYDRLPMIYEIEFRAKALRDLKRLSPDVSRRIVEKLDLLCQDMSGDVKRLVNFTPGFRLRRLRGRS